MSSTVDDHPEVDEDETSGPDNQPTDDGGAGADTDAEGIASGGSVVASTGEVVYEPWTFRSLMRDYKKVPIMALLCGVIAFMGSMIVPPTYASGTRVLIRGRETTLLASSGETLDAQPGVLDSQLATSLAETQAALLVTRSVAEEIVDRLDLDAPADNSGVIGTLRIVLAETYLRSRAIITHGFYKKPERRERMIGMVQGGIGAKQVENGYVLEIAAIWEEPEIAAAIANEAADILVEQSTDRFATESAAFRDFLSGQLDAARNAESSARAAVAGFQRENGITAISEELLLSTRSIADLDDDVDRAQADLEAARAQLATLESELEGLEQTISTDQEIRTGRSETIITGTEINPAYSTLSTQVQQTRAQIAGLEARLAALAAARGQVVDAGTAELTDEENALRQLLFDEQIAAQQVTELTNQYNEARLNAARPQVELLRLDTAAPSLYPVGPKRYLYLGIGMFVGGLAGFLWSFLAIQRREQRLRYAAATGRLPESDLAEDG